MQEEQSKGFSQPLRLRLFSDPEGPRSKDCAFCCLPSEAWLAAPPASGAAAARTAASAAIRAVASAVAPAAAKGIQKGGSKQPLGYSAPADCTRYEGGTCAFNLRVNRGKRSGLQQPPAVDAFLLPGHKSKRSSSNCGEKAAAAGVRCGSFLGKTLGF